MRRVLLAAWLASMMTACMLGPTPASVDVSTWARGVAGTLATARDSGSAELLAVQGDTALLVLRAQRVMLVSYTAITRAQFGGNGAYPRVLLSNGRAPSVDEAAKLRLQSRFPQGVNAALQRRLLAAYGQNALLVVGRPGS
ncbi:MAG TPA: hypothetical protein VFW98_06405 [Gemmatimonadaceae bacterium]|nr:hypothetical protein [Gemmatimonadaceae bacterium]